MSNSIQFIKEAIIAWLREPYNSIHLFTMGAIHDLVDSCRIPVSPLMQLVMMTCIQYELEKQCIHKWHLAIMTSRSGVVLLMGRGIQTHSDNLINSTQVFVGTTKM